MKKEKNDKLKYFLSLDYPMVVTYEKEDGVYVVQFPDLPGCMAHGSTPARAIKLAEIIRKEWIEDSLEAGQTIPVPKREEEYSGKFVVRIESYLHKRLSEQADREGRSLNQHVGGLLSERSASFSIENSLDRFSKIEEKLQGHLDILEHLEARLQQNVAAINRVVTTQMVKLSSAKPSGIFPEYIMPKINGVYSSLIEVKGH